MNIVKGWIKAVNTWIEVLSGKLEKLLADIRSTKLTVIENQENIQLNYELIYEIKDELEEMRLDLNGVKLILLSKNVKSRDRKLPKGKNFR